MRLSIKEPPIVPQRDLSQWATVDVFGADPSGERDSSTAVQAAIDSGATTVFFPGRYRLAQTVQVRGVVERLVGLGGHINYGINTEPSFRIAEGAAPTVSIEHLSYVGGGVEVDSNRTLIARSVSDCDFMPTDKAVGAEWYFEDVVTHRLKLDRQRVWARQLNVENEGTHIVNRAGQLWILGYKTERGGTLIQTLEGGSTELLGGFSYTTTAGKLAPMFDTVDSQLWAFFGEVCFNGDPFQTLVREVRGNQTKLIDRDAGSTWPYSARPHQ